jgi:hypothetical protein
MHTRMTPSRRYRSLATALTTAVVFFVLAPCAAAQEERAPSARSGPVLAFVAEVAAEFGGEPIATVEFTDGTTQQMPAGQGLTVALGGQLRPSNDSPLGLRATVGFKFEGTAADNANIYFTRVPVELVGTYDLPQDLWIGAGYVRHTLMGFKGDDFGPDLDFSDANGATVELGWRWVALSFTGLRYTDEHGTNYDASAVGLSLIYNSRLP